MLTIFIMPLFLGLRNVTDYVTSGWIAAIIIMTITVIAAFFSKETFNKDLNYLEVDEKIP